MRLWNSEISGGDKSTLRWFRDGKIAEGADPVSCAGSLMKAYDDLSKHLRLLDDITLRISSVQPLDSAFRFPPVPHPLANKESARIKQEKHTATCVQPLEVMIQLEGSGNWPMDELAMEKSKTALILRPACITKLSD
ncbi:nucleolar protein 6-like isoform X2 [Salvia hispanica]|uniref:nucleolar protein 6-like isoform X2 n=1 Tax=Salvia hispanica TaxID=49212 RepID=UPI0020094817|nr:nucleolar protein 6-like isoform X2 [Salvia hispanica]